jgi:hypothetical protein
MQRSIRTGLIAGLIALSAPAAAVAAPANVTVRVEGATGTLVDSARVLTNPTPVVKDGHDCSGTSVGGALDRATAGNWEATYGQFGHFITSIMGEMPSGSGYWGLWVNHKFATAGACGLELQEGDQVLFLPDHCDQYDPATDSCTDQVRPLGLTTPARATTGLATQVSVVQYAPAGTATPVAGARVSGAGVDAVTDAAGNAAIVFSQEGTIRLRAEKAGSARSEAHDVIVGGDTATRHPGAPATPPDRTPPAATLTGLADKKVFALGPRELRGRFAADASGIKAVKLRLTKRLGKRCWYYSGRSETFRGTHCGRGPYFAIGDRADWSYLLPSRLGPGRYVLDAVAIDGAGNRTPLERGSTRVVFTVK